MHETMIARFPNSCVTCGRDFVVGEDEICVNPHITGPKGGKKYEHVACANPGRSLANPRPSRWTLRDEIGMDLREARVKHGQHKAAAGGGGHGGGRGHEPSISDEYLKGYNCMRHHGEEHVENGQNFREVIDSLIEEGRCTRRDATNDEFLRGAQIAFLALEEASRLNASDLEMVSSDYYARFNAGRRKEAKGPRNKKAARPSVVKPGRPAQYDAAFGPVAGEMARYHATDLYPLSRRDLERLMSDSDTRDLAERELDRRGRNIDGVKKAWDKPVKTKSQQAKAGAAPKASRKKRTAKSNPFFRIF